MKLRLILLSGLLLGVLSCATVPITGRKQLNLLPVSTMNSLSFESYQEFLSTHELSTNVEQRQMVTRVGQRVAEAVEEYFTSHNMPGHLQGYEWEFSLVEDPGVNAWALPGGKVVVFTGILPIAQDEAGLAVIMGHEIAHAVANHGNERMSQALIAEMGGMALSRALDEQPEKTRVLFLGVYGFGSQLGVLLPYSRTHESEADRLGLVFLAMAGYDPHSAVPFWERMAFAKEVPDPPEFLSTHPSDARRIETIKQLIPEAMEYYRKR